MAVRRISQGLERGNACHTTSGIFTFLLYLTVQTFAHSLSIYRYFSLCLYLSLFLLLLSVYFCLYVLPIGLRLCQE